MSYIAIDGTVCQTVEEARSINRNYASQQDQIMKRLIPVKFAEMLYPIEFMIDEQKVEDYYQHCITTFNRKNEDNQMTERDATYVLRLIGGQKNIETALRVVRRYNKEKM